MERLISGMRPRRRWVLWSSVLLPALALALGGEAIEGPLRVALGAAAFVIPGVLTAVGLLRSRAIADLLTVAVAGVGVVLAVPIGAAITIHLVGLSIDARALAGAYLLVTAALVQAVSRTAVPGWEPSAPGAVALGATPPRSTHRAASRRDVRGLVGLACAVLLAGCAVLLSVHSDTSSGDPFTETAFALSDGGPTAVVITNLEGISKSYEVTVLQGGNSAATTLTIPAGSTESIPLDAGDGVAVRIVWPGSERSLSWSARDGT